MTVGELLENLKRFPEYLEVYVRCVRYETESPADHISPIGDRIKLSTRMRELVLNPVSPSVFGNITPAEAAAINAENEKRIVILQVC